MIARRRACEHYRLRRPPLRVILERLAGGLTTPAVRVFAAAALAYTVGFLDGQEHEREPLAIANAKAAACQVERDTLADMLRGSILQGGAYTLRLTAANLTTLNTYVEQAAAVLKRDATTAHTLAQTTE